MPYCQHCGQEVAEVARWCRNCGQPLSSAPPGTQEFASPAQAPTRTPGNAVASLVLGLVGLLVCPVVCSILALVFGYQARTQIRDDAALSGEGMATAGVVLGWVGIAFWVVAILIIIATSHSRTT